MPDEASKQRYAAILNVAREHCDELVGKESRSVCDMRQVEFGTFIDIDGDGKEDYVSRFIVMDPPHGGGTARPFVLTSDNSKFVYIPEDCDSFVEHYTFSYNARERSLYYGTCNLTQILKGVK